MFDAAVQCVVVEDLRLVLSTKEGTTRPFDTTAEFIRVHFYTATPARPTFRPTAHFKASLKESVGTLRKNISVLMALEGTLQAAGRLQLHRN